MSEPKEWMVAFCTGCGLIVDDPVVETEGSHWHQITESGSESEPILDEGGYTVGHEEIEVPIPAQCGPVLLDADAVQYLMDRLVEAPSFNAKALAETIHEQASAGQPLNYISVDCLEDAFTKAMGHAPKVETEKRYAAVLGMLAGIRKDYARTRPILTARIRKIARSALWPQHHYSKGQCDECGLPYNLFPCDMNIQDHLWEKINDKAPWGLLCPTCICKRLMVACNFTAVIVTVDETGSPTSKGVPNLKVYDCYVQKVIKLVQSLHRQTWKRVYDEYVDCELDDWTVDTAMDKYNEFLIEAITAHLEGGPK